MKKRTKRSHVEVYQTTIEFFSGTTGKRKWVSAQQSMQYRMARREYDELHPIFGLRKLGQLYVIDAWSRILESRLYHVREHNKEVFKAKRFFFLGIADTEKCRSNFFKALEEQAGRNDRQLGMVTTLPDDFAGSPR